MQVARATGQAWSPACKLAKRGTREVDRDTSGNIESAQFPGLALNVTALEAGNVRAAVGLA